MASSRISEGSYALDTTGGVDAVEFEELQREGRGLLDNDPLQASETRTGALDLWKGPAYADLANEPALGPEITRLESLRLAALGDRIDADLDLGRTDALVGELEGLIQVHPLQERFRAQHMKSLYHAGRQAEALRAFQEFREHLGDEMGITPSEDLVALELQLVTGVGDDMLIWNLDTSTWLDVACQAAGRNMTQAEWEQFGPSDAEYHATCPQYGIEA